jgi:hypothetical protein
MRDKRKILMMLFLATALFTAKAQSIVIQSQEGSEQTISLSDIQKITFSDGYLVLNYNGGTTQSYAVSTLRKLSFNSTSSTIENALAESVHFFYQATDQHLYFHNLPDSKSSVTVFRTDGILVIQTTIFSDGTIDASSLPTGIYLVKVNNQVYKFQK